MNKASFDAKREKDILTIYIRGYLDESIEYPDVVNDDTQLILLDCERLQGLNSVAIAHWIRWISDISAHTPLRLQFCQRQLVTSLNMVASMLPDNSEIESLYVPYFCSACDYESHLFFKANTLTFSKETKRPLEIPEETPCVQCKKNAALDVVEKLYFSFLEKRLENKAE